MKLSLSDVSSADVRSMFASAQAACSYGGEAWQQAWELGSAAPKVSTLDLWRRDRTLAAAPTAEVVSHKGKQPSIKPWRGVAKSEAKIKTASAVRQLNDDPTDAVRYLHRMACEVASDVGELRVLQAKVTDGRPYVDSVKRTFKCWLEWCSRKQIDPVSSDVEEFCQTFLSKR